MAKSKIAYYIRTSTKDPTGDGQLGALRKRFEADGIDFAGVRAYFDKNESSTKATRPEMERLKADAMLGRVDTVYAFAMDRIGRSVNDLIGLFQFFQGEGHKVDVVLLKEQIDLRTAAGKLFFHIIASFAEFERERARERSKAWMDAQKKAKLEGKPYKQVGRHRGRWVADAWAKKHPDKPLPLNHWDRLEEVQKAHAAGLSRAEIARSLSIPRTTVFRMLQEKPSAP